MINAIMQELAAYLEIKIILADQDAPKPKQFPYAEYLVLRTDFEHPHQRIRKQNEAPDDMVEIRNYYGAKTVVQLNIYNKGNTGDLLDVIMTHAQNAWMWLHEEGREVCRQYNVVPMMISPEIKQEEKSPKKENKFHVGFDFALKGTLEHIKEIEAITGVDYTIEVKI